MSRWHIGRDNWFLVIPAFLLGLAALYTVHALYRAGDIRRAIEVVISYRAGERPTLGEYLGREYGAVDCRAEVVSSFYGTLDVRCTAGSCRFAWRVHVGQRAFAPADEPTRALMRAYAPELFDEKGEGDALR